MTHISCNGTRPSDRALPLSLRQSPSFQYISPACRSFQPEEVVTKGLGYVAITTSVIETHEYGWPCNVSNTTQEQACAAGDMVVAQSVLGQCSCDREQTFFVKGTENMRIAFEHTYFGSERVGSLSGVSNIAGCDAQGGNGVQAEAVCADYPLVTKVKAPNGTISEEFPAGRTLELPLHRYLSLANLTLDTLNNSTSLDARSNVNSPIYDRTFLATSQTGGRPHFRTTGVRLNVELHYSNLGSDGRAEFGLDRAVEAEMVVKRQNIGWAGMGPIVYFPESPTIAANGLETCACRWPAVYEAGLPALPRSRAHPASVSRLALSLLRLLARLWHACPLESRRFSKVTRYRQGVVIEFVPTGFLYTLDYYHLITTIVAAFVLLNIA